MLNVVDPYAKTDLIRELHSVHKQSTAFWSSFDTAEFFAPIGDAWSPADNVRHLIKSNRPVAKALETFRLALLFRFGFTRRPSRSYVTVRTTYLDALAGGLKAGRFAPTPQPPPENSDAARRELMERRDLVAARLLVALTRWNDWSLDHLRLPHPALGKLTTREMLFFTLYHNLHHVENVARRKGLERTDVPGL